MELFLLVLAAVACWAAVQGYRLWLDGRLREYPPGRDAFLVRVPWGELDSTDRMRRFLVKVHALLVTSRAQRRVGANVVEIDKLVRYPRGHDGEIQKRAQPELIVVVRCDPNLTKRVKRALREAFAGNLQFARLDTDPLRELYGLAFPPEEGDDEDAEYAAPGI